MPKVTPFRAVRPTRDKVGLISSRPYHHYTQAEREARLDNNPFSFLHIVNPGYKYHKEISGPDRYELVKNRYQEFREDHIFIQDEKPNYYIYRLIDSEKHVFTGIVAATSLDSYKSNLIKRHEETIAHREDDFKEYLETVGFNAEPVLLTHPDNSALAEIIKEVTQDRPEYEFTTTYRDTHYLWTLDDEILLKRIQEEFSSMDHLYIADGHHRSASAYQLYEELRKKNPQHTGNEPYNYFMSYIIPESNLKILEFNRLIKDLNGLSKEEFLIKLDNSFRIQNRKSTYYRPLEKHQFSMYLDGEFYSLHLRKLNFKIENSLSHLDAQVLYKTVLEPILGIKDPRNDQRLDYAHGKKGMPHVKGLVDSGAFKVGFGMVPASVEEMKNIANEGLTMPPKSTYIEPKLRSGITIYEY
ncbi:uncharacterized protein (DUF1015 family) [Mesonia algae]|uniref:Uncharacterized protein (DUF1015 family) n=1 Tax=Mesonia algae TaxID=213248 RepID=A0A2W7IMT8_9FLAO|nr:DUF1015 domain-containing protein [Mesonia algae]PZW40677.1 uncharacterized protein (DUF1015 family) [Mesonia algae]